MITEPFWQLFYWWEFTFTHDWSATKNVLIHTSASWNTNDGTTMLMGEKLPLNWVAFINYMIIMLRKKLLIHIFYISMFKNNLIIKNFKKLCFQITAQSDVNGPIPPLHNAETQWRKQPSEHAWHGYPNTLGTVSSRLRVPLSTQGLPSRVSW